MSNLKLAHNLGAKIKVTVPYIHNLISRQTEIVEKYYFYHVLLNYSQLIISYSIVELFVFASPLKIQISSSRSFEF